MNKADLEHYMDALKGCWEDLNRRVENLEGITDSPAPITCCGEWTWDEKRRTWWTPWANTRYSFQDPGEWQYIIVCRKCHRALLEDGKMTGPLVDINIANVATLPMPKAVWLRYTWDLDRK